MEKIMTSQSNSLYSTSKVSLGSELFYICELGKYLNQNGHQLSLLGVSLVPELRNSRFWEYLRLAVDRGWLTDVDVPNVDLAVSLGNPIRLDNVLNVLITENKVEYDKADFERRLNDEIYNQSEPKLLQVAFKSKDDKKWCWTLVGNSPEDERVNMNFKSKFPSQALVSLVAYVAVQRYLHNTPEVFNLEFTDAIANNTQLSCADLYLLMNDTTATDGWLEFDLRVFKPLELQLGYEAWWYKGYDNTGLLHKDAYLPNEKYEHAKALGISVGSVVALYKRNIGSIGNHIKSIENYHFAVVESCTARTITLHIINSKLTKFGGRQRFNNMSMAVKQMYSFDKNVFSRLNSTKTTYSWVDLGVEYVMSDEEYFITPLQDGDTIELDVTNGVREDRVLLGEVDAVFWLLKDYEVEFDEEHYIKQYYAPNMTPAYYSYMNYEA